MLLSLKSMPFRQQKEANSESFVLFFLKNGSPVHFFSMFSPRFFSRLRFSNVKEKSKEIVPFSQNSKKWLQIET